MIATKQIALVAGFLILLVCVGLPEGNALAQELPEVFVEVRIGGAGYNESQIDVPRLENDLTATVSGILNQIGNFGFISFKPRSTADSLKGLPRAEFELSERTLSSSHQHWLSMSWHPSDSTLAPETVFEELIFGVIDEHHSDDENVLRAILTDTLEQILRHDRFTDLMMQRSFANITLAQFVVPDSSQIVHIPIPQSLLHASTESSFQAWFSHPTDFSRSGFLRMKVAFPADMFPGSNRTSCFTDAFQIPVGNNVAAEDMTARWRDVVRLLSEDPDVKVLVKMLKYVPEGIRGVTDDGVIVAGGSP